MPRPRKHLQLSRPPFTRPVPPPKARRLRRRLQRHDLPPPTRCHNLSRIPHHINPNPRLTPPKHYPPLRPRHPNPPSLQPRPKKHILLRSLLATNRPLNLRLGNILARDPTSQSPKSPHALRILDLFLAAKDNQIKNGLPGRPGVCPSAGSFQGVSRGVA